MEQMKRCTTWKTELQVQDFVPNEVRSLLAEHKDMVLWIEYDNEALQELADETMFYMIGTRLAQAYVDNMRRECNSCETCKLCMQASVYEEGTESLTLKELGQLINQTQWVTFALEANPTCVERAFTDRMFWLVGLGENRWNRGILQLLEPRMRAYFSLSTDIVSAQRTLISRLKWIGKQCTRRRQKVEVKTLYGAEESLL